jgi:hypothetical protein
MNTIASETVVGLVFWFCIVLDSLTVYEVFSSVISPLTTRRELYPLSFGAYGSIQVHSVKTAIKVIIDLCPTFNMKPF